MAVRIEIPEDIEHHLETQWGNLPRHALEALAIEGYRARVLSRSQVRRMLGFETGVEVDEFMKRSSVLFHYTMFDHNLRCNFLFYVYLHYNLTLLTRLVVTFTSTKENL